MLCGSIHQRVRGYVGIWAVLLAAGIRLAILSPLVFATNLVLFLWREVVRNIESFPDLLWGFALDHVCDSLAADI